MLDLNLMHSSRLILKAEAIPCVIVLNSDQSYSDLAFEFLQAFVSS